MASFDRDGLSFRYPEEWELSEGSDDAGNVTVHVQSPQTAFWSLTISAGQIEPNDVFDAVAAALRSEYDAIELHPGREPATISGQQATTCTIEFVVHELPVICECGVFAFADQTVLVMTQYADVEAEQSETLLDRMTASLRINTLDTAAVVPEAGLIEDAG